MRSPQIWQDHFKCYSGGNCVVNMETRTLCKKCRLDKCFAVGMQTRFLANMGLDWDSDTLIIDLLTGIILFDPSRPNLINKPMIKLQQNLCQTKTIHVQFVDTGLMAVISMPSHDRFKCYLNKNCVINIETRSECKKCRLDKCFAVEFILFAKRTTNEKRYH
ncbi:unnamed protein product [Medioppia subpectinata]|uniref:Nuclear receptor domain-containing protein n=1 Tax=Medioppia subpectinata TaxID=1979941 RepID=A0A7R9PT51_9ACAR|nr:unnamed protein product [Medioppia subpectinata]CAG2100066.1 unnamed protein product [Medioppia subpectinata]